ncbi:hypothetical protein FZW96_07280 [Bacillus sp. BGMRC 2118]|nr:hypothetical protein FZW96_07280 [Bacillus sp. BGMRC 2118]
MVSKNKLMTVLLTVLLLVTSFSNTTEASTSNKWIHSNGNWSYYNANGALQTGWLPYGGTWYFFDANGNMKTGWVFTGAWYYFNQSGAMQTGWVYNGGNWYYMSKSGAMQTSWIKSGSTWYFLKSSGAMQTGWAKISNAWYYFTSSGAMQTGWVNDRGTWYYLSSNGDMQTGWIQDGGAWYYLDRSGVWDPDAVMDSGDAQYYAVSGTESNKPGIYKYTSDGASMLLLEEKVYELAYTNNPPITLEDLNYYTVRGQEATSYDQWGNKNNPIQFVQAEGSDVYFTKFLFSGEYAGGCGGGFADILELYKMDVSGTVTLLTSDKISSINKDQFFVSGDYIYYAKIENRGFGNFTLIKMNVHTKEKTTLNAGIDNFWVKENMIYFTKEKQLHTMDLNGQGLVTLSSIPADLYGMSGCDGGNYYVTENGIYVQSWEDDNHYFYDENTKTVASVPVNNLYETLNGYPEILDVDVEKQQFVALVGDYDTYAGTLGVYDFSGNLLTTIETFEDSYDYYQLQVQSLDIKKRQFIYVEGTELKMISF